MAGATGTDENDLVYMWFDLVLYYSTEVALLDISNLATSICHAVIAIWCIVYVILSTVCYVDKIRIYSNMAIFDLSYMRFGNFP